MVAAPAFAWFPSLLGDAPSPALGKMLGIVVWLFLLAAAAEIIRAKREQHKVPADVLTAPRRAPVEYMLHLIATGEKIAGPLDPKLSRIGQQITDSAVLSAREKRTVALLP